MSNSQVPSGPSTEPAPTTERSRRTLLKFAAAGLGGVGLVAATGAEPASATAGDPVLAGEITSTTGRTTVETSDAGQIAIRGYNTATTGSGVGLYGDAAGPDGTGVVGLGSSIGVSGSSSTGVGVAASSTSGTAVTGVSSSGTAMVGTGGLVGVQGETTAATSPALYATGSGMIRMEPEQLAPPVSGFYFQGSMLCSNDGSGTWVCVTSGTPGVWQKLAGPKTAGAFHAISPQRVYDSTHSSKLAHGHTHTVSVANGIKASGAIVTHDLVPAGATAVALNLSILSTTGHGVLTAWPYGLPKPLSTVMQWTAAGQALTNGFTAAISKSRKLSIACAGTGSTHLHVDVGGYYL